MNFVESLNLFGVEAKQIPCIKGSGVPTSATEGVVGCFYMDTDNGEVYKCTSVEDGVYIWAEFGNIPSESDIPSYWEEHLTDKITTIKALQEECGKNCFSFVVIADMHYPRNLAKCSPLLAKRIIDECNIKYALCLGDTQTRGCHSTEEKLREENEKINKMLLPLRDHLLRTQGNHDGNWGYYNDVTYAYRISPAALHEHIYRPVWNVGDAHFDASGSGYYIDDISAKVRYIVLNTHNTIYELNEDGTQKYPNMKKFRFMQSQYDLVVEALTTIPSDEWAVVAAGHVALGTNGGYSQWGDGTTIGADCYLMENLLTAYQNKTAFSGVFNGTAVGKGYTNLANPLSEEWSDGYRITTSGLDPRDGATTSNIIPCGVGDVVRVKGANFRSGTDRYGVVSSSGGFFSNGVGYVSTGTTEFVSVNKVDDVYEFMILHTGSIEATGMRFAFATPENASDIIITVNEPIVEGGHGYDHVEIEADFTTAKGTFVGFFGGHTHMDSANVQGINRITTRCDAPDENNADLQAERVAGTVTEQSFDVFTINKATRTIHATKIGAGLDRTISY